MEKTQRIYTGTMNINSKADGYVRVIELEKEGSVFVDHDNLHTALAGDTVEIELLGKKEVGADAHQLYGKVLKIVEMAYKK